MILFIHQRRSGSVPPLQPGQLFGRTVTNQVPRVIGTTWNPADKYSGVTLSQSNTVGLGLSGVGAPQIARATASKTSSYQDFYFEVDAGNPFTAGGDIIIGLDDGTSTLSSFPTPGRLDSKGISYRSDGNVFFNNNSGAPPSIATYARGQRVGIYVSPSRGKVWFSVNNKWDGDPVAGTGGFSPGLTTYIPFAGANQDEFFFGYWDRGSLLYPLPGVAVPFDEAAISGIAVGVSTETDTALAQSIGLGLGLATENDAALALTAIQIRAAGLATETDTAFALTGVQKRAAGFATETDAALGLGLARGVGVSLETDTALALSGKLIRAVGLSTETDTALALTVGGLSVGVAIETDSARALGIALGIGLSAETDAAIGRGVALKIAPANDNETAFALAALLSRSVGLSTEADTARALGISIRAGIAVETDSSIGSGLARGITPTNENSTAFALAVLVINPAPPPQRRVSRATVRNDNTVTDPFRPTSYATPRRAAG